MRKADKVEEIEWTGGFKVEVETWVEPTDIPYDGNDPRDVEGCEGWDVSVRVTLRAGNQCWAGTDSLGSIWCKPGDRYLDTEIETVQQEALANLAKAIEHDATGEGVKEAKARQKAAQSVVAAQKGAN